MVLVVEPNQEVGQSLAVAIERARPGTPVTLVNDAGSALRAVELGAPAAAMPPSIAIIGPGGDPSACGPALRKALGARIPLVAFSPNGLAPSSLGADGVYRFELEWRTLQRTMHELLAKWLN